MKKPYADYACFALKAFFSPETPQKQSRAEELNEEACWRTVEGLEDRTLNILRDIFQNVESFFLGDAITKTSEKWNIPVKDLWTLVVQTEKRFAQQRGLI